MFLLICIHISFSGGLKSPKMKKACPFIFVRQQTIACSNIEFILANLPLFFTGYTIIISHIVTHNLKLKGMLSLYVYILENILSHVSSLLVWIKQCFVSTVFFLYWNDCALNSILLKCFIIWIYQMSCCKFCIYCDLATSKFATRHKWIFETITLESYRMI